MEALSQFELARKKLTSQPGIKSTLGKRRDLEQNYGQAVIRCEKEGIFESRMKSKAKHRYDGLLVKARRKRTH